MDLAALIISILALTASVASLSVQVTLAVLKYREMQAQKQAADAELNTPTAAELERFFNTTPDKDKQKMGEILENPDLGKYSGIDEEFNI